MISLISKYIAEPFQALSQSLVSVLIVTFFVSLFWFFGIHGTNVLGPVLDSIWGPLQLANMEVYNKVGLQGVNDLVAKGAIDKAHAIDGNFLTLWVRGSWDAYSSFGGTCGTLSLIIAILWSLNVTTIKQLPNCLLPQVFSISMNLLCSGCH